VFSPDKEQKFIYMIDGMNGEVRIVDHASKQTLARFGRPGRQVGQFTALHNIAVERPGQPLHLRGEYRPAGAESSADSTCRISPGVTAAPPKPAKQRPQAPENQAGLDATPACMPGIVSI
jgi:hypothetical protein